MPVNEPSSDYLSVRIGAQNHREYMQALADAKGHIDKAICSSHPAVARTAIRKARAALGVADTRVSNAR